MTDAPAAPAGSTFAGRITTITPVFHHIDKAQPRCKILVTADDGSQLEFFVSGLCPVIVAGGENINNGWKDGKKLFREGQRVEIEYSIISGGNKNTNGKNGADLIRCLD